jgi:hypothetical protein
MYRFTTLLVTTILLFSFFSCSDQSTGPDDDTIAFSHRLGPGQSAAHFVSDERFKTLTVEIDYMQGYRPTNAALTNLHNFLSTHLDKQTITILEPTQIPALNEGSYSANRVRDLEEQHRSHYSEGENLVAYFLFLDGEFQQGSVVGIAYYNTSMALFGKTIHDISDGITQPSRDKVESTIMHHEFGHILGLVNIGADMQEPHEDADHPGHCTNNQCLMYWAIETRDFFANIFDNTVPELDAFCVADLNALRQ